MIAMHATINKEICNPQASAINPMAGGAIKKPTMPALATAAIPTAGFLGSNFAASKKDMF